jgi:hypothetical protein
MARPLVATELYLPNGSPSNTTKRVYQDTSTALLAFDGVVVGRQTELYTNKGVANLSGAAANIDTYALSGLTSKDTLIVYASMSDPGCTVNVYNSTDSTVVASIGLIGLPGMGIVWISTDGTTATNYAARRMSGSVTSVAYVSMATAFTGSWTVALRSAGAGSASVNWQWSVWRLIG